MDLARRFSVHPSTVTGFLLKMARAGLIEYRRYHGASLSERGREVVRMWLRRHRLVEKLLVEFLHFSAEEACREAVRFDHLVSDAVVNRICAQYNHPSVCPCGKPIYRSRVCER